METQETEKELHRFFVKGELIPVICQDEHTGEVLMLGYANEEALRRTMETGTAWFFSRSRQTLWNKGETSGNIIRIRRILSDCDDDTLIYSGTPSGPVCHTGHRTCFFTTLWEQAPSFAPNGSGSGPAGTPELTGSK